jgi:hypothetical protein
MIDKILFVLVLVVISGAMGFKTGWDRATERHQLEMTTAAQNIKESVRQASDALYDASTTVTGAEQTDDRKLQEITDAATAAGNQCLVDADRLRALDAIAR